MLWSGPPFLLKLPATDSLFPLRQLLLSSHRLGSLCCTAGRRSRSQIDVRKPITCRGAQADASFCAGILALALHLCQSRDKECFQLTHLDFARAVVVRMVEHGLQVFMEDRWLASFLRGILDDLAELLH